MKRKRYDRSRGGGPNGSALHELFATALIEAVACGPRAVERQYNSILERSTGKLGHCARRHPASVTTGGSEIARGTILRGEAKRIAESVLVLCGAADATAVSVSVYLCAPAAGDWMGQRLPAGAFSLDEYSPVLAQRFET